MGKHIRGEVIVALTYRPRNFGEVIGQDGFNVRRASLKKLKQDATSIGDDRSRVITGGDGGPVWAYEVASFDVYGAGGEATVPRWDEYGAGFRAAIQKMRERGWDIPIDTMQYDMSVSLQVPDEDEVDTDFSWGG